MHVLWSWRWPIFSWDVLSGSLQVVSSHFMNRMSRCSQGEEGVKPPQNFVSTLCRWRGSTDIKPWPAFTGAVCALVWSLRPRFPAGVSCCTKCRCSSISGFCLWGRTKLNMDWCLGVKWCLRKYAKISIDQPIYVPTYSTYFRVATERITDTSGWNKFFPQGSWSFWVDQLERDTWTTLFSLSPLSPSPGYAEENGWMYLIWLMKMKFIANCYSDCPQCF